MAALSYKHSASIFLRLLALVYLIAISSFWVQIDGLIGSQGISPIATMMDAVRHYPDYDSYRRLPTLCHISSTDLVLHLQCAFGITLAVVGMCGIAPMVVFTGLWVVYLSLCVAGQTFMSFQWDNLLLEAGFLAIFLSAPLPRRSFPAETGPRLRVNLSSSAPSSLGIFCLRLLLFKLMFGSALVKISSGDPAWFPDFSALTYHYETTCLPIWTAWYAAKLPLWFQQLSCLVMMILEFAVPLLFFGPRRLRYLAFALEVFLQIGIAATGNYTFFNLLTVVLCVSLLDDGVWRNNGRDKARPSSPESVEGRASSRLPAIWRFAICLPVYSLYIGLSLLILSNQCDHVLARFHPHAPLRWPQTITSLHDAIAPFRTVNGYGLFANMTKSRPEIIVEGSNDGIDWKAYEFKWKVGDPLRRPGIVAPHQPRLDWQMWFAALSNFQDTRWFAPFLVRLLEGSEPVLDLLKTNPFPDHPPRYIRANLYDYHFSDRRTRHETGAWWIRSLTGPYAPTGSLSAP